MFAIRRALRGGNNEMRIREALPTGLALVMALLATAGGIGLIGGGIDFGARTDSRLPFESLALAGVALLLAVAVPMWIAFLLAWAGSPRTGTAIVLAGWALLAWILIEVAVVGLISWMQPACAAYGVVMILAGEVERRPGR
ncbi:MAG TPA: hypothetical protein VHC49_22945 [Mycobacteriales bacterium]|nr:hypothetical protein [Mycobacteriales bacterium]